MDREIVVPGQLLSENTNESGSGTYVKEGKVYSLLYGVTNVKNRISVIPFSGKYIPSRKDFVIGTVFEITSSNWIFDIGSPYDGLLHVSEYPRRIESSMMREIFNIGDSAILRINDVDASMKIELTLREKGLRKIKGGRLIKVPPTKVPRVIGHNGSMVSMLKKETECEIFVGQNGRIWINGKDENMDKISEAIDMIIRESHTSGLTDKISQFLQVQKENEKDSGEEKVEDINTDLETVETAEPEDTEDAEKIDEISRKVDQLLDTEEN
ncbi:exosome complex RNA-binding protein Rrp4 [uncultured Methanomethylovorans sp.]|uniref:exosome complex RNA-binding protein Rrp4 n=1 Tax=uncultured Methanomethylovorans sp. TaxID=183759 RepID=UPI002AA6F455|nr:exosome complex RNA-binding protein Rrp4 [uncultured Methanomethylovorans sp.]